MSTDYKQVTKTTRRTGKAAKKRQLTYQKCWWYELPPEVSTGRFYFPSCLHTHTHTRTHRWMSFNHSK